MFDLVIFHCDGVLVDSEPLAAKVDTGPSTVVFEHLRDLPALHGPRSVAG
jgi:phosphoglycolate phosphatase-like HAD superfamily hydrolase